MTAAPGGERRAAGREHAAFLAEFLRNPFSVGSVAPSSRWLAARMVREARLAGAGTVVELGPGTGAITRAIVRELDAGTRFLAIESNEAFAAALVSGFPRARVLNDTAERLPELLAAAGCPSADCILSSLPFAAFPRALQDRLLDAVVRGLAPGGRFVTYAYIPAAWLATGRSLRRLLASRFPRLEATPVVWRNLPPAFVYRAVR